jgi:glycine/D-amino acid oxidase-like deaminating enzyme
VLLVDAWGPAHARASSGGESRLIRGSYGADEIYTRMAWESLAEWRALSARAELPLFHRAGVLFFFPTAEDYVRQTVEVHRRLGLPTKLMDRNVDGPTGGADDRRRVRRRRRPVSPRSGRAAGARARAAQVHKYA